MGWIAGTQKGGEKMTGKGRFVKLVGINGRYTHSCLALFYVRNEIEQNCPQLAVRISQFTIKDDPYQLVLRLAEDTPEFVFFSVYIWNSSLVEKLITDLRQVVPDCFIVIGGPQAREVQHHLGERSCTLVEGPIESVEPLFWQDVRKRQLANRYGPEAGVPRHHFASPYRPSDFALHLENRAVYYESSRGCPFCCSYCLSATERGVHHLGIEQVKDELFAILEHRPRIVRFVDRTFNDIPDRALEIWRFLLEQDVETRFHFEMAPDRFTEEMFDFLAGVPDGKFQFEIGIQSTHLETLEAIQRHVDLEATRYNMERLAEIDRVFVHLDLILGLPYETRQSFAISLNEIFSMGGDHVQMGLLKVLPDTPLMEKAKEYDISSCKEPPYEVLSNKWMDHAVLGEMYWLSECVEKFRNNRYFPTLWEHLQEVKEDIFHFFHGVLTICKEDNFFDFPATQELLIKILVKHCRTREDFELILDILRYDWLRCGKRYLPKSLTPQGNVASVQKIRSMLYQTMPSECDGLYSRKNRNSFFRKTYFLHVSPDFVQKIGLIPHVGCDNYLCFTGEKEQTRHEYQRVILLPSL